ncbi:MAG: helix-turn-helix transcriptional regulator [Eggerthellaceae bacterium]|nr:helix-turn-helix transcriptional regulator [Eggerthellaceae bacterium]
MDILFVFSKNVKKYREAIGLSQEAFAEKCGLHRTYISAVERQRRSISLANIQRIADALEIETYLLFVEDEDALRAKYRAGGGPISKPAVQTAD